MFSVRVYYNLYFLGFIAKHSKPKTMIKLYTKEKETVIYDKIKTNKKYLNDIFLCLWKVIVNSFEHFKFFASFFVIHFIIMLSLFK